VEYAGGLVGYSDGAIISKNTFNGNLSDALVLGGIIGGGDRVTLSENLAVGDSIRGNPASANSAGGIAGEASYSTFQNNASYFRLITNNDGASIAGVSGGIIGTSLGGNTFTQVISGTSNLSGDLITSNSGPIFGAFSGGRRWPDTFVKTLYWGTGEFLGLTPTNFSERPDREGVRDVSISNFTGDFSNLQFDANWAQSASVDGLPAPVNAPIPQGFSAPSSTWKQYRYFNSSHTGQ
jgi:hypothetical protein